MKLNRHQLLEKLLKYLGIRDQAILVDYRKVFLEQLVVHTRSHRWQFVLQSAMILPYPAFLALDHGLKNAFHSVKLVIRVKKTHLDQHLIRAYWPWVIQHSGLADSLAQQLTGRVPVLRADQSVVLTIQDAIIKKILTPTVMRTIQQLYCRFGFPRFRIQIRVDQTIANQRARRFRQQQTKSNSRITRRAVTTVKHVQHKRHRVVANQRLGVQSSRQINQNRPVTKIDDITEETRSLVLCGCVIAKDAQPLYSGRQRLLLTMADDTSRIDVQKFTRSKSQRAVLASVKEGSWFKVWGAVRPDPLTQELVVTAYDLNPVAPQCRKDQLCTTIGHHPDLNNLYF